MEFEVFKKVVDEFALANPGFASNSEIWLHGFGESLVHPEFARFMRYAIERGLYAGLSINPLMLTPEVATELLESMPAHLYLSLDGHDDASFEQIRGVKNAYERSKERLLAFLNQKVAGGYSTYITLSMIDFSLNQASIEKMTAYWQSVEGIDHVLVKPFTTWDGTAADVNALVGQESTPPLKYPAPVTCEMPWLKMTVKWDGDVVPCCFDYDKKYVLGNVNEQSLAEIWNGERMRFLRQEMASDKVTNPLCQNCEHLRGRP
jgi:radical SAM protein with 4Fe4S-binding SPASM domain